MAAERLRHSRDATANAVAAQLSAVRLARRALGDTTKHIAPRALQTQEIVEEAIQGWGTSRLRSPRGTGWTRG